MAESKAQATDTKCSADRRFRKAKTGACVGCKCAADPPECTLYPGYNPNCCGMMKPPRTPHHVLPGHCFRRPGSSRRMPGCAGYRYKDAPCICVKGGGKVKEHGKFHDKLDAAEKDAGKKNGLWSYADASEAAAQAIEDVTKNKDQKCSKDCIKAQLDDYHLRKPPDGAGLTNSTELRANPYGKKARKSSGTSATNALPPGG